MVQGHTTLNLGPPPTAYKVTMAKFAESSSRTAYKPQPLKVRGRIMTPGSTK